MKHEWPRSRIPVYIVIAVTALTIDLVTKSFVFQKLGVFQGTDWLLNRGGIRFELHTSLNEGALWGMGQGFASVFALLSIGAVSGIVYWLFARGGAASLWLTVALAMVSGGAIGNCYDRLGFHGERFPDRESVAYAVRDFLRFQFGTYDYPIFNFADVFLVTGAVMLMIQSFFPERASVESGNQK